MNKRKDLRHLGMPKATNITSNTAIISHMAVDSKRIKMEVENILGYKVDNEQYEMAYDYATHKLDWQSKLYATKYSKEYLAIIIAETYEDQIRTTLINITSIGRLEP